LNAPFSLIILNKKSSVLWLLNRQRRENNGKPAELMWVLPILKNLLVALSHSMKENGLLQLIEFQGIFVI
jgi:hypothetical protein